MKIKIYVDRIPKGAKCRREKYICRWYYSPSNMCMLFDALIDGYSKCEKCLKAEEVF